MNTLIAGAVFLSKTWLMGTLFIWLAVVSYIIFWLAYDWRWHFKKELPPKSVMREVRRLEKLGWLKGPIKMSDSKVVQSEQGEPTGEIKLRFKGECDHTDEAKLKLKGKCSHTATISCNTLERQLHETLKNMRGFQSVIFLSIFWPVCVADYTAYRYRKYRKS
jgi:hypothetical protein